ASLCRCRLVRGQRPSKLLLLLPAEQVSKPLQCPRLPLRLALRRLRFALDLPPRLDILLDQLAFDLLQLADVAREHGPALRARHAADRYAGEALAALAGAGDGLFRLRIGPTFKAPLALQARQSVARVVVAVANVVDDRRLVLPRRL